MSGRDIEIRRFKPGKDQDLWNEFVLNSDPSSFLFNRNFMDYHSDRFEDYSLLIYKSFKLIAVCPAHKTKDALLSHRGLTYGGVLFDPSIKTECIEWVFLKIQEFLRTQGFKTFEVKAAPHFYGLKTHLKSLEYLRSSAQLQKTEKVFAIDYREPLSLHKTKLKHYRKNHDKDFEIREETDFSVFWNEVLIPRLEIKHGVKPVHSLDEIGLLKRRFPDQIRQFNLWFEDTILAGITIFDKGRVVKSQYGATTPIGQKYRALEYLFIELIYQFKSEKRQFFSMGTASDSKFKEGYNPGLVRQKQELGCQQYSQYFYKFDLS